MTASQSYGDYKLKEDSNAPEIRIPTLVVTQNSEIIELAQSGIKTKTDSFDRLLPLRWAAMVSVRHASGWRRLDFVVSSETENGKEIPRKFDFGVSFIQVFVDAVQYRETLTTLLALDSKRLSFLVRASELLDESSELSILAALFGLELELNRFVPQGQSMAGKISCLKFARVISDEALRRLQCLKNLRSQLAHGKWTYDDLGKSLAKLLGGTSEDWLRGEIPWITPKGARYVLNEVIKSISDLHECEERWRHVQEALQSQPRQPTDFESEEGPVKI